LEESFRPQTLAHTYQKGKLPLLEFFERAIPPGTHTKSTAALVDEKKNIYKLTRTD